MTRSGRRRAEGMPRSQAVLGPARAVVAGAPLCRLGAVLVVMAVLPPAAGLAAGDQPPSISGVRVGFDGQYKVGYWTPLEIAVQGGSRSFSGHLSVTVPDGDGVRSRVAAPLELAPDQQSRALVYVKFGRRDGDMHVSIDEGGQSVASRVFRAGSDGSPGSLPVALSSQQRLIVSVGPSIGLEDMIGRFEQQVGEKVALAALSDASQLPTRWIGYEGVDTLVLMPSSAEISQMLDDPGERLAALEEWLDLGGRLLLVAGADAQSVLAADRSLARLVPGTLTEMTTMRRTMGLESYSRSPHQVPLAGREAGLSVARVNGVTGQVVAREGEVPLVIRSPRAFGEVVFVAVDLSRPPLSVWQGRAMLLARLLAGSHNQGQESPDEERSSSATSLGITDLAGQLRGALDQFQGIRLAPFWLVAVLASLYVLLIGPFDYFVLRKIGRLRWTWATFCLYAVSFSVLAWWLAHQWKGAALRVNQVDVIDVDAPTGLVRGTTWLNVFSPRSGSYELSLDPQFPGGRGAASADVLLSWFGLPGSALGGMEPATSAPASVSRSYQFSPDLDAIADVPIQVWSTRSFTGRWHYRTESRLRSKLRSGADGVAEGTLTSQLDVPLSDCLLVSGRWAYLIGELAPGQTIRVRAGEQRDLQPLLKDFKLIQEKKGAFVQVATPYDRAGFHIPSILQQMMFYQASGGRSYSGLAHRYQGFADLSGHLALGRAILVGRGPVRARIPLSDPDSQRWGFYRFVLPLEEATTP